MAENEPAAAAPVVAPVVATEGAAPAAAPPPAVVAEPARPAEAAPVVVEPPKVPDAEPTLLETAKAAEPAKAVEPKAGEPKPGEAKPGEQPKPADGVQPQAFEFKPYSLPEGFKADEARIKAFNDVLVKPDLDPQGRGQALLDLHAQTMQQYAESLSAEQHRVFAETRKGWRDEIKADPELGGAGYQTTIRAGARMRDLFVKPEHRPEFETMLRVTGAGDHPALWRFLTNVAKRFDEPAPLPQAGFKPPPDVGRKPGSGGRREAIYDHPTSDLKRAR